MRWGQAFLLLGMVVEFMAFPHQSSVPSPSSSLSLARQRRQLGSISEAKLRCILKALDAGKKHDDCDSSAVPSSPSFPSPTVTHKRKRRQMADTVSNEMFLCLLIASDEGRSGNSCNSLSENSSQTQAPPDLQSTEIPSINPITQPPVHTVTVKSPAAPLPTDPDTAPASPCRCVPHWQCKDKDSEVTVVDGSSLTSFVLDLRSGSSCFAPEEICCMEVDVNALPPTVPSVTSSLCGTRNPLGVGNTFLGFKDRQSQFGEFPWVAAIVASRSSSGAPLFVGGGSLIHPQVVLTVAHKISNYTADQLKVRLGEWNLATQTEPVAHEEYQVRQVRIHPGYVKEREYYGAALLVLDRPAKLGSTINTICPPSPRQEYLSTGCVVSGWGKLDFNSGSKYQKIMKKLSLPVVDHAQCQTALQGTRLGPRFILHDSFLCAGGQEGQDACTGDGGSPLACPLQSDPSRYVQVGVVSWGIGCGTLGVPGVYVDVAKVRTWIDQVIDEVSGQSSGAEGKVPFDVRVFSRTDGN